MLEGLIVTGVIVVGLVAVLVAGMVRLCASGRIPRNQFAGIRLPALFASDAAWRAGHRAALVPTVAGSAVAIVIAAPTALIPAFGLVGLTVETLAMFAGVIVGAVFANRAASRVAADSA